MPRGKDQALAQRPPLADLEVLRRNGDRGHIHERIFLRVPLDGGVLNVRFELVRELLRRPNLHLESENDVARAGSRQALVQSGAEIARVGDIEVFHGHRSHGCGGEFHRAIFSEERTHQTVPLTVSTATGKQLIQMGFTAPRTSAHAGLACLSRFLPRIGWRKALAAARPSPPALTRFFRGCWRRRGPAATRMPRVAPRSQFAIAPPPHPWWRNPLEKLPSTLPPGNCNSVGSSAA